MTIKIKLIETLVSLLPEGKKISVDTARVYWFYNIRDSCGMRLSDAGFKSLVDDIRLEFYEHVIEEDILITPRNIIEMDRRFKRPFYLSFRDRKLRSVAFFDEMEYVAVQMYGDLKKFIENYT